MKKILAVMLILALALLPACSDMTDATEEIETAETAEGTEAANSAEADEAEETAAATNTPEPTETAETSEAAEESIAADDAAEESSTEDDDAEEEETAEPTVTPEPTEIAESSLEDDGMLRVALTSLGDPEELTLTFQGEYAVEGDAGFRFDDGTTITLALGDDDIWLVLDGLSLSLGESVTLTRHTEGGGMMIAETGSTNLYQGDLTITIEEDGLRPILSIYIEDYLKGVVAYEMSDSWPLEALKAQAVAARTYALGKKFASGGKTYDLVDTTSDQVFKGYNAEYTNVIAAVDETAGIVGIYNDYIATCYYTASNGGQVARPSDVWGTTGDYGYIELKDDPYDLENPYSMVNSLTFSADLSDCSALLAMIEAGLSEDAVFQSILSITPGDADPEETARYTTLTFEVEVLVPVEVEEEEESEEETSEEEATEEEVTEEEATPEPSSSAQTPKGSDEAESEETAETSATATVIPTFSFSDSTATPTPEPTISWETSIETVVLDVFDDIKDGLSLGLNSGDYELITVTETEDGGFTLEMRRYGHGVGMSQRGAQWMAGHYDMTYDEILAFYYPGMTLEKISWSAPEITALETVTYGAARPDPTPTPTPAPLPDLEEGETYATVVLSSSSSTLNVRENPTTSSRVLAALTNGQSVIVCSEPDENGWVQIRTAEVEGYVMYEYLSEEE